MTFELTRIKQRLADLENNQRSLLKITDGLLKQMETTQQAILELDEIVSQKNENVWVKPSELADILKISTSTVTKYRNQGLFNKTSTKKIVRGKRTDFFYHRINAVKDISIIKPIQIENITEKNTGKDHP